jgi:hypothetical protein
MTYQYGEAAIKFRSVTYLLTPLSASQTNPFLKCWNNHFNLD